MWARVLREIPTSRLLLKAKAFFSKDVQERFLSAFERHGIVRSRLVLRASVPSAYDHLKVYNQIDVALDTFPYNGTTTTCETLLMGVPVLNLRGQTHGSRVGNTLLSNLGLS